MRKLLSILASILLMLALPIGAHQLGGKLKIGGKVSVATASGILPISVTGKNCVGNDNFSNPTCTWSADPAIGETIHCAVMNAGTGASAGTPYSVTDNASTPNVYTANGSAFAGTSTGATMQLFDSFSITHSPHTSTFTQTGSVQNFPVFICFSTTGGVGAADGAVGTYDSNISGTTLTTTVNPTGTADIAYGWVVVSGSPAFTAGTGFTLVGSNSSRASEQKILSSSGSQTCTMTYTPASVGNDMICGTYK